MSYSSEVLADSPLAYYRLGESSGTTMGDSSGNSRNGTYTGVSLGTTGLLTGDADTAATFSSGSKGEVAAGAWMDVSALTVEAIIKPSTTAGTLVIASRHNDPASWSFRIDNGQLRFLCWHLDAGGGFSASAASATLLGGTLYHVAVTLSGSALVFYVNGVAAGTGTTQGTPFASGSPFRVGASFAGENFSGVIDEVAFYGTALSSTRIAAHYTAGSTTPPKTGTFAAATLPHPLTASLSGTYTPPTRTGTLSATLPHPLTTSLSGTYTPPSLGTLAATLPTVTASLDGTYTPPPVPVGSFDVALPFPTAEFTGTYTPPLRTGTLDATLPGLDAALSGTYLPLEVGTLDATLPTLTADLTGTYHALGETGTFAAVLPVLSVTLVGTYDGATPTDTSNSHNGRRRNGSATVTIDRPVVAPPATLTFGTKVDKAVAYPVPTMVEGRPT